MSLYPVIPSVFVYQIVYQRVVHSDGYEAIRSIFITSKRHMALYSPRPW